MQPLTRVVDLRRPFASRATRGHDDRVTLRRLCVLGLSLAGAALAHSPPDLPPIDAAEVPALIESLRNPAVTDKRGALMKLSRVVPVEATRPALPLVLDLARAPTDWQPRPWQQVEARTLAIAFLRDFALEPGVLPVLEAALSDENARTKQAAVGALPPKQAALPAIEVALHHPQSEIRRSAAETLGRFTSPTPELLQAFAVALQDGDEGVRAAAARGASSGAKGQTGLGPAIMSALRTERDQNLRASLMRALLETGGATRADVPALVQFLASDPYAEVRANAALVLGHLRATAALPALTGALAHDSDAFTRAQIAEALGLFGPAAKDALPTLIAMVTDKERNTLRFWAVTALAAIDLEHRPDVDATLRRALSDCDLETQARALIAVRGRGRPDKALASALLNLRLVEWSHNGPVWLETLRVLELPVPAAVPVLDPAEWIRSALDEGDRGSRQQATARAKAWGGPLDPRWLPGLTRSLQAPDDDPTRCFAVDALGHAGPAAVAAVPRLLQLLAASAQHPTPGRDCKVVEALRSIAPNDPRVTAVLPP
jgi:HEAT repeat protein